MFLAVAIFGASCGSDALPQPEPRQCPELPNQMNGSETAYIHVQFRRESQGREAILDSLVRSGARYSVDTYDNLDMYLNVDRVAAGVVCNHPDVVAAGEPDWPVPQ